jgi:hypothetical protein
MSLAQVTLVDALTGRPITPDDQGDASAWPASNLVDGWFWSVADDEREALERAEVERITDLHDAPPDPWPTAEEVAEFEEGGPDDPFARAEAEDAWRAAGCPQYPQVWERWQEQAEASRNFYRSNGSFSAWLDREGGPRS